MSTPIETSSNYSITTLNPGRSVSVSRLAGRADSADLHSKFEAFTIKVLELLNNQATEIASLRRQLIEADARQTETNLANKALITALREALTKTTEGHLELSVRLASVEEAIKAVHARIVTLSARIEGHVHHVKNAQSRIGWDFYTHTPT